MKVKGASCLREPDQKGKLMKLLTVTAVALTICWSWVPLAIGKVSVSVLEGVWVPEKSLEILRGTLSPSAAGGAQVVIKWVQGKQYELLQTNFREGVKYHILALIRTKEPSVYTLKLREQDVPDLPTNRLDFRIRVNVGARGVIGNIVFLDGIVESPDLNTEFVRIPVLWKYYVNRLVFAGIWEDQCGRLFSFCESGKGYGEGGTSFTYKVPFSELNLEWKDMVWVSRFNPFQAGGTPYYLFERAKDVLLLYDLPDPQTLEMKQPVLLKRK